MLGCPIILSINCTKMTRTAAALVHGMTTFEPGLQFAGVVLNQVGTARGLLRKVIEEYTDVAVPRALPRLKTNPLPERHMGIASCGDELSPEARAVLDQLGSFVAEHLNLDAVMAAARAAAIADPGLSAEPFWSTNGAETRRLVLRWNVSILWKRQRKRRSRMSPHRLKIRAARCPMCRPSNQSARRV